MLLHLITTVLFHPIRSGVGFLAVFLLCVAVGLWPGRDVARHRAVTVGAFLYSLPGRAYGVGRRIGRGWRRP